MDEAETARPEQGGGYYEFAGTVMRDERSTRSAEL
jgi:hypothetical protein